MTTPTLSWAPSAHASRLALGWFSVGAALIGLVGFAVSFDSVMLAAWPYLAWAAWVVPVMVDLAIFVLTGLNLFMELHGIGARWIRLVPNGLALATLYLNTATQHSWFGKAVHAVGPALWIITVEIGTYAVRRMVGLTAEHRIEGLRKVLWVLRPWATWRIWRAMRVHQITTYRAALDREAAHAAVVGRLRLAHGRFWKLRAPLAERIALRLDGRDPTGVAEILRTHADTAALLAGTPVVKTVIVSDTQSARVTILAGSASVRMRPAVRTAVRPRWSRTRSRGGQQRALAGGQQAASGTATVTAQGHQKPVTKRPEATMKVAAKAVKLREQHPDMPTKEIAARIGVSVRTARRYLSAPITISQPAPVIEHVNGATV